MVQYYRNGILSLHIIALLRILNHIRIVKFAEMEHFNVLICLGKIKVELEWRRFPWMIHVVHFDSHPLLMASILRVRVGGFFCI